MDKPKDNAPKDDSSDKEVGVLVAWGPGSKLRKIEKAVYELWQVREHLTKLDD